MFRVLLGWGGGGFRTTGISLAGPTVSPPTSTTPTFSVAHGGGTHAEPAGETPALRRKPNVIFGKPIDAELVLDLNFLTLHHKNAVQFESLFLLTRESMLKSGLYAYHDHLQATNKFYLAAIVLNDAVIETIRRELRRVSDVKVEVEELRALLRDEVFKRDVLEGEKAEAAHKKVSKSAGKMLRIKREGEEMSPAAPIAAGKPTLAIASSDK